MKKNKLEEFIGKDILKGPAIRLNKVRLKTKSGKDYAPVVFFGDLHLGHPNCDIEKAKKTLDYCLSNNVYIFLMGDLLEAGTKNSIGDGVYAQTLNPQEQYEELEELLSPLAKAELIIGCHSGNHEARITKDTSVNLIKILCKSLNVPYLGGACWSLIYVGNQSYSLYSMHGKAGSKFIYTKIKAVIDIGNSFMADIIAMGHVHDVAFEPIFIQTADRTKKSVSQVKKHHIITGHYLSYDGSYAQDAGMNIGKMGSPIARLYASKKDVHVTNL